MQRAEQRQPRQAIRRAGDVMSRPVLVVEAQASLWTAMDRLTASGLRHLVVMSDGRCLGVLSDRAVALMWPLEALRHVATRVGQLVASPSLVVPTTLPAVEVARRMLEGGVDVAVVVNGGDRVVGIMTASDLLRHFVSTAAD